MMDELTTADDLTEGQIVIDVQEDMEIEVVEAGERFVLESEYGRTEVTREEVDQLIGLDGIRARTEIEVVDSILDNLGETVDDETAWRLAAGPSGKEDEIRNYPMGGC